jgi:hypothetical protein
VRTITRRFLLVVLAAGLALLALGALPSFLGSGDPYYLVATPTDDAGPAVNATLLPERRYPYLTTALDDGRSEPYRTGPFGLKEAFTHSPFDERDALVARNPDARSDGTVLIEYEGRRYRVRVTR